MVTVRAKPSPAPFRRRFAAFDFPPRLQDAVLLQQPKPQPHQRQGRRQQHDEKRDRQREAGRPLHDGVIPIIPHSTTLRSLLLVEDFRARVLGAGVGCNRCHASSER